MKIKVLLVLLVCSISLLFSATINIPVDQSTIQLGIEAAVAGDTILVQPGTYVERINFNGKNVTVASLYITTQDTSYISQTIIDGDQGGSVVTIANSENSSALLMGFTIRNGLARYGGGIYCNASPTIKRNYICDNSANTGNYPKGGGLHIGEGNNHNVLYPIVVENKVYNNFAQTGGGGIHINTYSGPLIKGNAIFSNTVNGYNTSYPGGGGIGLGEYCTAEIINNTISDNNSIISKGGGIALFGRNTSVCEIRNNIVSDNSGTYGIYFHWSNNEDLEISYCNLFNNSGGNFGNCGSDVGINVLTNANGDSCDAWFNIQFDPLFTDSLNGEYHLTENSLCIDSGHPEVNLDPDGTISDMGAYYFPHLKSNFLANPIFGYEDLSVDFTDASESYVSHWFWDFESDGIYDDFTQNPSHYYDQSGIYDVTLKIEYDTLSLVDSLMKSTFIIIQESELLPPQNPTISISGEDIIIEWDSVIDANYYLIYKSSTPDGIFEFIDYATGITTYTDIGIASAADKMFYFVIGFDGTMEQLTRFINNNQRKKFNKSVK